MSLLDDVKDLPESVWGNREILPMQTKRVKSLAPRARQFIFDEQASHALGRFIRECPDILVDQMEFARQPYEVTYIELVLPEVFVGMGLPRQDLHGKGEVDWKLGLLAGDGIISCLSNTREHPKPSLSPVCTIDHEYRPGKEVGFVDDSKVLLGTTWYKVNEAQRIAFANRFSLGFFGAEFARAKAMETMLPAMTGEARIYVAALLFLYQKHRLTLTDHAPKRGLSRGKLRTYMAHTTVTIHVSQYEAVKRDLMTTHERSAPRRHEVRTHYKHRHLTAGCVHEWVRVEDADNEQWRCTACAGLRWLCRSHLRGDGSIGFVTKHYEVKL